MLAVPSLAQGGIEKDPGDDAVAWLKHLDGRIYTQPRLDALSFQFRPLYPGEEGEENRKAPYLVGYLWRRDSGDRVDILGLDVRTKRLSPLTSLPGFSPAQFRKAREDFRGVARNLAGVARGMSLSDQYRGWQGRVRRVRINEREEVLLVLEPRRLHRLSRVVIHLNRERIPWKLDKTYRSGARVVQHNEYTRREQGMVITKMSQTFTAADPLQPSFDTGFIIDWHEVSGTLLPASVTRLGRELPLIARGKTELVEMRINDKVPAFEAMPDPPKGQ